VVTKGFSIKKNWSDYDAVVEKMPSSYLCCTFFSEEDKAGPYKVQQIAGKSQEFGTVVTLAVAALKTPIGGSSAASSASSSERPAKKFKADHAKAQSQQNMNKAREVLKKQRESLDSKRSITLDLL
jgi:hypothetical protein